MMTLVGSLKANADRKGAEALVKKYCDGMTDLRKLITERWLRSPRSSYVYSGTL
jgi:hypothetical protein